MGRIKKKPSQQENVIRSYFLRLFDKYDLRDQEQFNYFWKWLIFLALVIVEAVLILRHINEFDARGGLLTLIVLIVVGAVILLAEVFKLFLVRKKGGVKTSLYVIEALAACSYMFITDSGSAMFVYVLVFTEIYFGYKHARPSAILLSITVPLYVGTYFIRNYLIFPTWQEFLPAFTELVSGVFTLVLHFIVIQVGLAFYRQFLRLDKALKELDESKRELEKAYAVVAEVTALEERQRIAKDIHDTAGHSITTVIMQTEAAKLIIDKDAQAAKAKIVSANLQAKHALEELRDSVHLLSGQRENQTLKSVLEDVIHESTDGTGITVRSEIQDVSVSPAKRRFLCNSLKEGISNALRHGGATAFWFELKESDDVITFILSDNGKGAQEDFTLGFGLSSMQNRAKALGGEVRFNTDEGFELQIELPKSKGEE